MDMAAYLVRYRLYLTLLGATMAWDTSGAAKEIHQELLSQCPPTFYLLPSSRDVSAESLAHAIGYPVVG